MRRSKSSRLAAKDLRCVFGSANGDGPVVGSILDTLTQASNRARAVSPTQFHNSVHNAAAGYWSIATRNPLPATCLGCHNSTWAAALLFAMLEVDAGAPVLLCVYDHPMPAPYAQIRPVRAPLRRRAGAGSVRSGRSGATRRRPLTRCGAGHRPEQSSAGRPGRSQPRSAGFAPAGDVGHATGRALRRAVFREQLAGAGHAGMKPHGLLPHGGAMGILDRVLSWDGAGVPLLRGVAS